MTTKHVPKLLSLFLLAMLLSGICQADQADDFMADAELKPEAMELCESAESSVQLAVDLYGDIRTRLEWDSESMDCDGMLRPDAQGIRLVFAGPIDDERLLIVMGIDGNPDQLTDGEHKANITIIAEATGRFYSTGSQDRCWTAVSNVSDVTSETNGLLQVSGEVYCTGGIPSLSNNASITLRDLRYTGLLVVNDES